MRKLLLLFCIPLLFSCVDEEIEDLSQPENFSFTAEPNYFGPYDEGFLILHEQNGVPIEYKPIRDGNTVDFLVDKSKKHHITLIMFKDLGFQGEPKAVFKSWVDQDLVNDINLVATDSNVDNINYSYDGTFQVNISNTNPITSLISSTKGYATAPNPFGNSVNATMVSYQDVNRYLAVAYAKSGESRYQFIDNVEKDQTYNLNYEDMTEFDHVLKFPKSEYSQLTYNISSANQGASNYSKGYTIKPSNWNFTPEEFYEIGFISEIDTYFTKVYGRKSSAPKTIFLYEKLGSAPSQLAILDIDEIKISKYTITDFEISTIEQGSNFTSNFLVPKNDLVNAGYVNFTWDVYSENAMKFSLDLPEELKSRYNLMDILPKVWINKVTIQKQLYEKESESDPFYEFTQVSQDF